MKLSELSLEKASIELLSTLGVSPDAEAGVVVDTLVRTVLASEETWAAFRDGMLSKLRDSGAIEPYYMADKEERAHIVLEELLGLEDSNRLADLCKSWALPVQELLQKLVYEALTKEQQDQWDFYHDGIERNVAAIAAMTERRKRIMIEIASILAPAAAPRLQEAENARIHKLLGDYGTVEDLKTERAFAEVPAMLAVRIGNSNIKP